LYDDDGGRFLNIFSPNLVDSSEQLIWIFSIYSINTHYSWHVFAALFFLLLNAFSQANTSFSG
jgi:hypothetical protein